MAHISDVIKKLENLTESEKMKWEPMTPPSSVTAGTNSSIHGFFGSQFNRRNLGMYEERYPTVDEDSGRHMWDSRLVLAFFNDAWDVAWEAPRVPGLAQLYDAIKYREADVQGFFKEILTSKDD